MLTKINNGKYELQKKKARSDVWNHCQSVIDPSISSPVAIKCNHCDKVWNHKTKATYIKKHIQSSHNVNITRSIKSYDATPSLIATFLSHHYHTVLHNRYR